MTTGADVKRQLRGAIATASRVGPPKWWVYDLDDADKALAPCVLLTAEEAGNVYAVIGDCTNGAREARERARALLTPEGSDDA